MAPMTRSVPTLCEFFVVHCVRKHAARRLWIAICGLALSGASIAHAESVAVPPAATVKDTISGATLNRDTPLGTVLPVTFSEDGTMSGRAPSRLAFFLGSSTDQGRWWVANERLCYRWRSWFKAEQNCMKLRINDTKVTWVRDDGETGTATIAKRQVVATVVEKAVPEAIAEPPPVKFAPPSALGGPLPSADQPAAPAAIIPQPADPSQSPFRYFLSRPAELPAAAPAPATAPPVKPEVPGKPAAAPTIQTYRIMNVRPGDTLSIRSVPSMTAAIVGRIPTDGRGIRVTGACAGPWCPIAYGAVRGWVNRFYLAAEAVGGRPRTLSASKP